MRDDENGSEFNRHKRNDDGLYGLCSRIAGVQQVPSSTETRRPPPCRAGVLQQDRLPMEAGWYGRRLRLGWDGPDRRTHLRDGMTPFSVLLSTTGLQIPSSQPSPCAATTTCQSASTLPLPVWRRGVADILDEDGSVWIGLETRQRLDSTSDHSPIVPGHSLRQVGLPTARPLSNEYNARWRRRYRVDPRATCRKETTMTDETFTYEQRMKRLEALLFLNAPYYILENEMAGLRKAHFAQLKAEYLMRPEPEFTAEERLMRPSTGRTAMTRPAWDKAWRRSRYVAHQDRLAGESCVICGSTEKIERDHSDPRTKTYNVSQMYTHSEEVFLAELAKTLPLCRACHVGKYSLYLLTDGTTKPSRTSVGMLTSTCQKRSGSVSPLAANSSTGLRSTERFRCEWSEKPCCLPTIDREKERFNDLHTRASVPVLGGPLQGTLDCSDLAARLAGDPRGTGCQHSSWRCWSSTESGLRSDMQN